MSEILRHLDCPNLTSLELHGCGGEALSSLNNYRDPCITSSHQPRGNINDSEAIHHNTQSASYSSQATSQDVCDHDALNLHKVFGKVDLSDKEFVPTSSCALASSQVSNPSSKPVSSTLHPLPIVLHEGENPHETWQDDFSSSHGKPVSDCTVPLLSSAHMLQSPSNLERDGDGSSAFLSCDRSCTSSPDSLDAESMQMSQLCAMLQQAWEGRCAFLERFLHALLEGQPSVKVSHNDCLSNNKIQRCKYGN